MSFYVQSPRRRMAALAALAALIVFPMAATSMGQEFYISFANRVLIYGLAATSLNLVLGFGGMISFGHAAFVGIGAYCVSMLAAAGITQALASWPLAAAAGGTLAFLIGAVSLRTRGVYFIMITLAFAQMLYYLFVSLQSLGGDDGLSLKARNGFAFGIELQNDASFYFVILGCLVLTLLLAERLLSSRFGRIIQGIRENETRMEAVGYPVYAYKLAWFSLAGTLAGFSGALLANQTRLASPNLLFWTQSGMFLVMVVLGGTGGLYGSVLGAALLLVLEEVLSGYTLHSQFFVGLTLLGVVFLAPKGLAGLSSLFRRPRRD